MAHTLATVRDQVENQLTDSTNLIFTTTQLDEAIRTSLAQISNVAGEVLTLTDLDLAIATTIEDLDISTLIIGAVAHALRFRMIRSYEEPNPSKDDPIDLSKFSDSFYDQFLSLLSLIGLRLFQDSEDEPYSEWDWDEEDVFS